MQTPLMKQYLSIKANYQNALLLFRLGDFYELFFEDAKIASKILNIVLTKRKEKEQNIPMAGIPVYTCDHYIAKLVKNGYKVALCEQLEAASSEKIIKREVVRVITSGTLMEDTLLDSKRNNYLLCFIENNLNFSTALIDISTNEFLVEDVEKENFKQFLEKNDPNEILIPQKLVYILNDYPELKNKITLTNEIPSFQALNIILNFFNTTNIELFQQFSNVNQITIATILEYIQYTQKKDHCNIKFPQKNIKKDALFMDKFTLSNLEITKTLQNEKKGSLLWLLDETQTPQGARKLYKTLLNPITNIEKLNKRYEKIEYFINKQNSLQKITENLKQIPDFERLISKIKLNRTSYMEIRSLAIGMINTTYLAEFLGNKIPNTSQLANQIIQTIQENPLNDEFIQEGQNQELDELKYFNTHIEIELQKLENLYKTHTNIANLRIKNTPLGFLVEINNQYTNKLDYSFILKQHLKTTSRYSTAKLEELNHKYLTCKEQIKIKEKMIFEQFCKELINVSDHIYQYGEYSAEIDLYANLANIALKYEHTKPILKTDNSFDIKASKHPILQKLFKLENHLLVENDCNLTKPIMFLTGPNMAGKSTFLRQQALICYMAHCGFFVPASYAQIGIIDKIFCRMSTHDNLTTGTSTFMMEMIEISLTINQATNQSFIILDEIGRGTCVEEGMAISQAVLQYLLDKIQARTLLSTHYLQLGTTKHANLQKKMMHIHVNPIHFTYKLIDGVAKKSYALEIAKIAGMPQEIIKTAEKLLKNID